MRKGGNARPIRAPSPLAARASIGVSSSQFLPVSQKRWVLKHGRRAAGPVGPVDGSPERHVLDAHGVYSIHNTCK